MNRTLSKTDEIPIATIHFKYRVAQRKFIDRLVWDRLRQNAPVYNGDVIRTAEMAEATLRFADDTEISISENSIIQVYFDVKRGASAVFGGGSIQVDSSAGGNGMQLISGDSSVSIGKGSSVAVNGERSDFASEYVSGALAASAESAGLRTASAKTPAAGGRGSGEAISSGQSAAPASTLAVQVLDGDVSFSSSSGEVMRLSGGESLSAGSGEVVASSLSVLSPRPNARFFSQGETFPVQFSWVEKGDGSDGASVLEVSSDKKFSRNVRVFYLKNASDNRFSVETPAGTYWWRISSDPSSDSSDSAAASKQTGAGGAVSGKFSVVSIKETRTTSPSAGQRFGYRAQLPSIRFSWTEDTAARSYILEIADNASMTGDVIRRSVQNASVVIPDLSEGEYHWRVVPVYQSAGAGQSALQMNEQFASAVSSFTVSRLQELTPPVLKFPAPGAFVDVSSPATFSWDYSQEAASYSLVLARNSGLSVDRRVFESSDNFIRFTPSDLDLEEGTWYWAVSLSDADGFASAYGEPQPFIAMDGQVVFSTSFPPENYRINESVVSDVPFSWKSNIPGDVTFQIARDSQFTDLVVNKTVSARASDVSGVRLPAGMYHWRVVGPEMPGFDQPLSTAGKRFSVEPVLSAPDRIVPSDGGAVRLFSDDDIALSWSPVSGAEYYQVNILGPSGETVYEDGYAEETSLTVNSEGLDEGVYSWTISARIRENSLSTGAVGVVSEQTFRLTRLTPVVLVSPYDSEVLDGLDAVLNTQYVRWDSKDKLTASRFVLAESKARLPVTYADAVRGNRSIIARVDNPGKTVALPALPPGTYWWTVLALADGGIDVSAQSPRSFRILPAPKLSAPVLTTPTKNTVFDADMLMEVLDTKGDDGLAELFTFAWLPVEDADEYELNVYAYASGRRTAVVSKKLEGNANTRFSVEDQSVFDKGDFVWTVEARRRFPSNAVQYGEIAESSFAIDLPVIPEFVPENPGTLYGH